eukprot:975931-Amphidinium_carterae.1
MDYMKSLAVYEEVDGQVVVDGGHALINTHWIDINKRDSTILIVHGWWYKKRGGSQVHKMVLRRLRQPHQLRPLGYFFPPWCRVPWIRTWWYFSLASAGRICIQISREVCMRPPPESGMPSQTGRCWKLLKAMYGLKDAGTCFEKNALG